MTPVWRPASNGAGKRHWFVVNEAGEAQENARGWIIWYASMAAAQEVADRLNEEQEERDWEAYNMIELDAGRYAE